MFDKILALLKTKYKDLGLSETILKVTAETLAKTVEKEEDIETAVAGVEGQMKIYQSFADQNRTLQTEITNLKKASNSEEKKEEEKKEGEEKKETGGEEVPAWAKAIIDSNKAILEKQNQLDAEKVNKTNAEKLVSKLKELGVNESFYSLHLGKTFEKEDEIDAFANTVKEAEDKYLQDTSNEKLKSKDVPLFGQTTKEGEVSPDVQALIDSKKS
ncbi:TPA: hypothetical protein JRX02_002908 [Elizabethkingia anophelis]|uniref:hypothetical protein n=1 Tax=Elizabethkingia anophelis TaxID=1117645 RepID=UPI0021A56166|nr:hypothetical protein [Elizabethkingia anophelis]MCT4054943.1 hypothetical protein [Elizabethkingia anophelis]HAY3504282.1 hypothetical protein [Elizabethkingia anophelis]HAY3512260.1 hypothetical protein [Elizabethkingia anophelis]HAY3516511.1 hypothetical protein [Elizabethkingia anophelis]